MSFSSTESDLNLGFGFGFDTMVIAITLYQTWGLLKIRRGADITESMSLSELVVREGGSLAWRCDRSC
jgi:hypothetical protein